uniref:Uncharacterized protein n=1 Tax=Arundo donax TaxID=35708 RepID=A0A0A9A6D6_ARUDO
MDRSGHPMVQNPNQALRQCLGHRLLLQWHSRRHHRR